jgi:pyroglutamyl-peptidase
MAKASILLTGFEPFDHSDENPSARVVEKLASARIAGAKVVTAVLPVSARRAPEILLGLLKKHRPRFVLMMGEMRGSACVRIERIAVNLMHASIADNDGLVLDDETIDPAGPAAYWTTLPHKAMLAAVRRVKVPCVYSFSAGTFLCNQMSYLALQWCAKHSPATKVGFIHLPSLPAQMHKNESPKPVMDLAMSVEAVRAAVRAAIPGDKSETRSTKLAPMGSLSVRVRRDETNSKTTNSNVQNSPTDREAQHNN